MISSHKRRIKEKVLPEGEEPKEDATVYVDFMNAMRGFSSKYKLDDKAELINEHLIEKLPSGF